MSELDRKISKHLENSLKLKHTYIGNNKISYEKSKELQKQQDEEYKKMMFFKNLRKEIFKNGQN